MAKDRKIVNPAPVRTRVNYKAVIILGGIVLALLVSIIPIKYFQQRSLRASVMKQAEAAVARDDKPHAIRLLASYLSNAPLDTKALALQGQLMAETAYNDATLLAAADVNDRLLRLDPTGPDARAARRRVIDMYIKHGELLLDYSERHRTRDLQMSEFRFPAAEALARAEVKESPQDAEAHRLLARCLNGEAKAGDGANLAEAITEFTTTLKLDPKDVVAAGSLAMIYAKQQNDPASADRVMDELLKASPKDVKVRLARREVDLEIARIEKSRGEGEKARTRTNKARAEMDAAVELDPNSAEVRYLAASDALRTRDTATARRHLDAIPKNKADTLDVRYLRGQIDFTDLHPDEAVDQWRKGLSVVGGTNSDLTFQLAFTLIQLGRTDEAKLLIDQYKRLEADETQPKFRLIRAMFEERVGRPSAAIADLELARDKLDKGWETELNLVLGRCYTAIGDEARALTALRRAASLTPEALGPHRAIAKLIQAQNPDGAIAELERARTSAPGDPATLGELVRLIAARQLALPEPQRNWDRAEAVQHEAEQVAPDDLMVILSRVDLLAARNNLDEAIAVLTRATEGRYKTQVDAWQPLVVALVQANKVDEAFKALDRAAAPDAAGDRAELRIIRARLLVQTGHAQAAKDLLVKSAEGVPPRERAILARARGDILRELGDRAGARQAYAEWASLSPDDSLPGLTLVELGQAGDEEATQLGLKALRAVGGDDEPYGLAANALALLAEPRPGQTTPPEALNQAERLVDRIRTVAPQLPVGHLLRGVLMERRQRVPEAITEFKQALKANTLNSATAHLVRLYTRTKRYDELADLRRQVGATLIDRLSVQESLKLGDKNRAEQLAAQLVEGQPDSLQFRTAQASLLRELGRPQEAQETLRELTVRQPNQAGPWLALLLFQVGQKDTAGIKATIDRVAREYKGDHADLLVARCRWLAGEIPEATKLYDAALAKHPADVETLKAVAEFSEANGRSDKAEQVLRDALKLDPSASWANRWLAMLLSGRNRPDAWAEAWSLVAPGASGVGDLPEDRLVRATVLARSPEAARRAEAVPALVALAEDLNASSPVAIEARVRLGQEFINNNRPADAARIIQPVADDIGTPNPTALAIAVEALSKINKPDEAQLRLDRLIEIEPKTARSVAGKAWVARARGKNDEAATLLESYLPEIEKNELGEYLSIAFLNMINLLDRPEVTERAARAVASRWPRDGWYLGRLLASRGKVDEGLDAIEAAAKADPTRDVVDSATNLLESRGGEPAVVDRVAKIVEAAHAKAPKDAGHIIALTMVRHIQRRYDDEVALYREALALSPGNAGFLNNMAWTLSEGKGEAAEGLKTIDEAIRRMGRLPQLLDTRGTILTRLGKTEDAIKDLEESTRLSPDPTTSFHLARAYLKAGRDADRKAARDKARTLGLNPKSLDPSDQADVDTVMAP